MYEIETEILQECADMLCDRIGLRRVTVEVSGKMRRLRGLCMYKPNLVRISIHQSLDEMDDTLRHEIAHMYAWRRFGCTNHSDAWKHACSITGARPEATYHITTDEERMQRYRYVYKCGAGCDVWAYRKKPRYERKNIVCYRHGKEFRKFLVKPVDTTVESAII